jgi:hypothetical protein
LNAEIFVDWAFRAKSKKVVRTERVAEKAAVVLNDCTLAIDAEATIKRSIGTNIRDR